MDSVTSLWLWIANTAQVLLTLNVLWLVFGVKALPKEIKTLGLFLAVDLLTELSAGWLSGKGINNMPLLHFYTLLEFATLSVFYKGVLLRWRFFQTWFWGWVSAVVILLLCNSLFVEPIMGFNSNAKTLVQAVMIGYAVGHFFGSFGKSDFTKPRPFALALINSGILVYYSGSLFVFMFSKILNDPANPSSAQVQAVFWLLNSFLFLIFQLLILVALWKVTTIRTR